MSSRREGHRLLDIIENIDAISEYIHGMSLETFRKDRKTIDATERCLMRITEAAIKIGEERMAHIAPALPLYAVRGFGNVLRHEYDRIDMKSIFVTLTEHLPELRAACVKALDQSQ